MWSPPYVAQPSASSERSPVPRSMAPSREVSAKRRNFRVHACTFSKVWSSRAGSWPIASNTCSAILVMSISRSGDRTEGAPVLARVLAPRVLPHAVLAQRDQIDVGHHRGAVEREALGLRDQLAALGDQPVAIPGQVRGRLAEAGGAVHLHGEVL